MCVFCYNIISSTPISTSVSKEAFLSILVFCTLLCSPSESFNRTRNWNAGTHVLPYILWMGNADDRVVFCALVWQNYVDLLFCCFE